MKGISGERSSSPGMTDKSGVVAGLFRSRPVQAARACLDMAGAGDLAHVAISRDPRAHFWTKVGRVLARPGDWKRLKGNV